MYGINFILNLFFAKFDPQSFQTVESLKELQPIINSLIIKASISGILSSIFAVGFIAYVLKFIRNEQPDISEIWNHYPKTVTILVTTFLVSFLTSFGYLLLIIPGIIIGFGLAMNQYIIADVDESISPVLVVKKSWEMMKGHKMEYFMLNLSFFGWFLLCGLSFGLLIIYVFPYLTTTQALFYNSLIDQSDASITQRPVYTPNIENNETVVSTSLPNNNDNQNNIFPENSQNP